MLIISDELIAIEEAIDQLVLDLKKTHQYKRYVSAKQAIEDDLELQADILSFQELKQEYDAKEELLSFRPEVKRWRRELLVQKRQIDCHPLVVTLRLAQVDFQTILADISEEIASAVSQVIFVDTGLPLAVKRPSHPSGPYQNIKEKGI
ncbi:YlbF family regulator [Streptococcus castoreus]|uniref:YlbF family regulator n=1 Tax=Streptococcus castoreus TaxID=254786 RepID=UPI0003FD48A3|nr:YlbF family regulator [Streptococcus castoreus]